LRKTAQGFCITVLRQRLPALPRYYAKLGFAQDPARCPQMALLLSSGLHKGLLE